MSNKGLTLTMQNPSITDVCQHVEFTVDYEFARIFIENEYKQTIKEFLETYTSMESNEIYTSALLFSKVIKDFIE